MVNVTKTTYKNYGNCIEISNGKITLKVTCDIGPRVIYLAGQDNINLMFEDENDAINKGGEHFDKNYKKGEMWHIYGGHRLWRSPEDINSYYPDNYEVDVEILSNGAIFSAKPEITTSIQKTLVITMEDDGEITIIHKFANVGDKAINCSLWALSVMNSGGIGYVPLSTEDTVLLPNRNIVIWPYTDIKDKRIDLRNNALVVKQDVNATSPIKFGLLNTEGVAYYLNYNNLFEKQFEKGKRDGSYSDHSSNVELYTSNLMMEIETLSEYQTILPQESADHVEIWNLYPKNSDKYNEVAKKINEN